MSKEEKEKKVQAMSSMIENLLQQIDVFTQILDKEDLEILEETKHILQEKISYKESAIVLLLAIGADSDTTEDKMKIKTLDLLIELIKTRNEFKEKKLKLQEDNKKKEEVINLLKNGGIL